MDITPRMRSDAMRSNAYKRSKQFLEVTDIDSVPSADCPSAAITGEMLVVCLLPSLFAGDN
jgi:hypothetical protein